MYKKLFKKVFGLTPTCFIETSSRGMYIYRFNSYFLCLSFSILYCLSDSVSAFEYIKILFPSIKTKCFVQVLPLLQCESLWQWLWLLLNVVDGLETKIDVSDKKIF